MITQYALLGKNTRKYMNFVISEQMVCAFIVLVSGDWTILRLIKLASMCLLEYNRIKEIPSVASCFRPVLK